MEENICPVCGHKLDTCVEDEKAKPENGDITLCFYCGELLIFSEDLKIKSITEEQFKLLDDDLKDAINYVKSIIYGYKD